MRLLALTASVAALLSGCATLDGTPSRTETRALSNPAGVKGLIRGDELRDLNVADLVGSFTTGWTRGPVPKNAAEEQEQTDKAIAKFYAEPLSPTLQARYRNEIQDRLVAAANQRCHLWKNHFAAGTSRIDFWSGVTAAATGAAALAFSPESTKEALTAVSTTSTAVGTQYSKSYLFNLTMTVIFQGVESRRAELLKALVANRTDTATGASASIDKYTLSAAVADALEYHAACSIASGLQQASEKVADSRDGGETPAPAGAAPAAPAPAPAPPAPANLPSKPTASPLVRF